jgi:hypothetical protein
VQPDLLRRCEVADSSPLLPRSPPPAPTTPCQHHIRDLRRPSSSHHITPTAHAANAGPIRSTGQEAADPCRATRAAHASGAGPSGCSICYAARPHATHTANAGTSWGTGLEVPNDRHAQPQVKCAAWARARPLRPCQPQGALHHREPLLGPIPGLTCHTGPALLH